jgi:hypothetical protein
MQPHHAPYPAPRPRAWGGFAPCKARARGALLAARAGLSNTLRSGDRLAGQNNALIERDFPAPIQHRLKMFHVKHSSNITS